MNKKTIITILLAIVVIIVAKKCVSFFYDKIQIMNAPTMQEISEANPWAVPADWFKTDTITIKGCIEDYDAERFGFTSMACNYYDVFEKNNIVLVLDIADDGSFCKKFLANAPVHNSFMTEDSKVRFNAIDFFARPGETIDITVRKGLFGSYECDYNNGSSRDVERWLRTSDEFEDALRPLLKVEGKFDDANEVADKVWKRLMAKLQSISRSENYTPMEVQLALADIQALFGMQYLGCIDRLANTLVKYEKCDSGYNAEILDSTEWNKYLDSKTYAPLRRIDYDNPILFASSNYHFLQNRIQYAKPVTEGMYKGLLSKEGGVIISAENHTKELSNALAALRDIMGSNHDNLLAQMCVYKIMEYEFDTWNEDGDLFKAMFANNSITEEQRKENIDNWPTLTKMWPIYIGAIKNPYIRQKAELFRKRRLAQKDLVTPLPDVQAADLIRKLVAKFPGKFLVIDFWGMTCGSCRSAIQESKELRAEIAKRNDVKLIFIAGERTADGSDAYKQYVAEWLTNEETVCLTNADFARLQEFFQFNGLPHYETITPDCRRVCENLRISGYHNFYNELERVLDKLK